MTPTKGRIVLFTYPANAVDGPDRMKGAGQSQTVPAIVVEVWSEDCVNLRVFQDGPAAPDWITSVVRADQPGEPGTWAWPPRQ